MELDSHELAWAAGFFDGEGTTGCVRQRQRKGPNGIYRYDYPALRILVAQSYDRTLLDRFQHAVLGIGKVYGPYFRGPQHGPQFHYNAQGFPKAQAVIALIWRWLGPVKRAQAKYALEAYTTEMRTKAYRPYLRGISHRSGRANASAFKIISLPVQIGDEGEDVPVNLA